MVDYSTVSVRLPNRAAQGRFGFIFKFFIAALWILRLSLLASAQAVELQEVLSIGDFYEVAEGGSIFILDEKDFTVSKYDSEGRLSLLHGCGQKTWLPM